MSNYKGGEDVPSDSSKKQKVKDSSSEEDDDWRQKCIDKFGLLPLPNEWLHDKLRDLSTSDNHIWKKYFNFRNSVDEDGDGDSDGGEGSGDDDDSDTDIFDDEETPDHSAFRQYPSEIE